LGQVDLYADTTTDNLLELEHHVGFTTSACELWKLATANTVLPCTQFSLRCQNKPSTT